MGKAAEFNKDEFEPVFLKIYDKILELGFKNLWELATPLRMKKEEVLSRVCGADNIEELLQPPEKLNVLIPFLYKMFDVDKKLPKVVSDKQFADTEAEMLYCGISDDANRAVNNFQQEGFKNYGTGAYGFGFYFSSSLTTPKERANGNISQIIVAKLAPEVKIVTNEELCKIKKALLPKREYEATVSIHCDNTKEEKMRIVSSLFEERGMKSLFALCCGFDVIQTTPPPRGPCDDKYEEYFNVLNRDVVIMPKNPILTCQPEFRVSEERVLN